MTGNALQVGDTVKVDSEGHDDDGRVGWLYAVDSGALYYVETGDGDTVLGPFTRGELAEYVQCALCDREAVMKIQGEFPVCAVCAREV